MFDESLTWKENILKVLEDGKWKSRKQIKKLLGLDHQFEKERTRALSSFILRLVRAGYVERAHAPDVIKTNYLDHVNYVYRRTKKKYLKLKPMLPLQTHRRILGNDEVVHHNHHD